MIVWAWYSRWSGHLRFSLDVYFKRSTEEFSSDAVARATAAKLKLESYYKIAVDAAIERNARLVCLFLPASKCWT